MQICVQRGDYLPSDHSTLQVINLDKFTKAAGVVVVSRLGITKGLTEKEKKKDRNTLNFKISGKKMLLLQKLKPYLNMSLGETKSPNHLIYQQHQ